MVRPGAHLIFNHSSWPRFRWEAATLTEELAALAEEERLLANKLNYIDNIFYDELHRISLFDETVSTLELDDEFVDSSDLKDTLSNKNISFDNNLEKVTNKSSDNCGLYNNSLEKFIDLYLDVRLNPKKELTKNRFFIWARSLARPGSLAGLGPLRSETFGSDPLFPGPAPFSLVLCPAPAPNRLQGEIDRFLNWFNSPMTCDAVIKGAVAHLWLLILRPFVVGTGRLARAVGDLVRTSNNETGLYLSLSKVINQNRPLYFRKFREALTAQDLDITPWLNWYIKMSAEAAQEAGQRVDIIINQAIYWAKARKYPLNTRQKNVLSLLLADFIGLLTAERYAEITRCDNLIAEKEFNQLIYYNLIERRFLAPTAPGRSL
ncbi:MAG: DUF4172 domain-containing protein [Deltaproteobacteria bacterium]|jgi:Fic family protein|nr:DUF4172 domain-containing protein [Deltaproteobacteria bacterium]